MAQQQIGQPIEGGIIFSCKPTCPKLLTEGRILFGTAEAGAIVPYDKANWETAKAAAEFIGMKAPGPGNSFCFYPEDSGTGDSKGWCFLRNERRM